MARAIDADVMLAELKPIDYEAEHSAVLISDVAKIMREWVERQPTLTPPNEPLTPDELRELDGEPVWFDTIKRWGIVRVCGYGISVLTKSGEYDVTRMKFYRRPPEGDADGE